jgi:hypothetical protein
MRNGESHDLWKMTCGEEKHKEFWWGSLNDEDH